MAQTLTIPLTTFQPETPVDFGPYSLKPNDNVANITVDRTVANGLDDNPAASLNIDINYTTDGGLTWRILAGAGIPGGPQTYTDRQGVVHPYLVSSVTVGTDLVRGAQIKGTVTAHGSAVAVSGTVNFTS